MSQPLPYIQFEYVEYISVFTYDFIINYDKFSDFSYTLVVDVDSPKYLQPEKVVISKKTCTFRDEKTFISHIRLLNKALKHRITKFKQNTWVESYISLNTEFVAETKKNFERNQYKFKSNNSVFGKTIQNNRKQ